MKRKDVTVTTTKTTFTLTEEEVADMIRAQLVQQGKVVAGLKMDVEFDVGQFLREVRVEIETSSGIEEES